MKRIISILCTTLTVMLPLKAQSLKFESNVHDFGQVLMSKGPVQYVFNGKNISSKDIVIQSITTTCNCTTVEWDREPVKAGANYCVKVKYTNDEGPYPFDKVITVKIVGENKPVLLHIRGISQNEIKPDSQIFTKLFCGALGFQETSFKTQNIEQGCSRGDEITVANLSKKDIKVSFTNISTGLKVSVSPNPIRPGAHAVMKYEITPQTGQFGHINYCATPVVNGVNSAKSLQFSALVIKNVSSLSKAEKSKGSRPIFKESTYSFNHKKQGSVVKATFTCENKGLSELILHSIDADRPGASFSSLPKIPAGRSASFTVTMDTKNLPKGEALVIVTLTTNSPLRPIVTLFLAGWID